MNKIEYVAQEPMKASVTITNRSGADVILGGPKGKAWLSFDVHDSTDRSISPSLATSDEVFVLKAGDSKTQSVQLSETHSLTDPGTYSVTVSAYHPPSGDYYQSNRVRFTITDIKPYGKPLLFGVPAGLPDAGRIHRHSILVYRDLEHTYLYYRLSDDKTNEMIRTYQLGPMSMVREPQYTLDRENSLHVMFLCTPEEIVHYAIGADGKPKKIEYYRDAQGTRPQMFLTKDNLVVVNGGVQFDPVQEKAATEVATKKTRSVSERPPGL